MENKQVGNCVLDGYSGSTCLFSTLFSEEMHIKVLTSA